MGILVILVYSAICIQLKKSILIVLGSHNSIKQSLAQSFSVVLLKYDDGFHDPVYRLRFGRGIKRV